MGRRTVLLFVRFSNRARTDAELFDNDEQELLVRLGGPRDWHDDAKLALFKAECFGTANRSQRH